MNFTFSVMIRNKHTISSGKKTYCDVLQLNKYKILYIVCRYFINSVFIHYINKKIIFYMIFTIIYIKVNKII